MAKPAHDNTLPIITHILAFFTGFLGPLIILIVTKDDTTKRHARTALNWQCSSSIYSLVSFILLFTIILTIPAAIALAAICVCNLLFCVIAAIKASSGECWHYPLAIPFFKE